MPLTNIQILRSAVPYKRPDTTFLLDGQLALNYKAEEPGLFAKLQNGDLFKIGPTAITTDGSAPNDNPAGPAGNLTAEKWFDNRAAFHAGVEKIWDGTQWDTVSGFTIDDATGDMTMLRALSVDTLNANAINVNGDFNLNGNLLPAGTSCLHDIGGAGERFNTLFGCELDVLNDASVGNNLGVINNLSVGATANVTGDLFVAGQQATFGSSCVGGNFTVETPTFLNCDVSVLGDIITGGDLTVTGDTTINGANISLGQGCGFSTLTVQADVIFTCPVQWANNIFEFGDGCATSQITFNGATIANCDIIPGAASSVDLGSVTVPYQTVYADTFDGVELTLTGKASSASTTVADNVNTLTTKDYVDGQIAAGQIWAENATGGVNTVTPNLDLVPNSGTGTLGTSPDPWSQLFANVLTAQSLGLTGKATSAATVDGDGATTLVTKAWVEGKIDDGGFWQRNGTEVSTESLNDTVVPNGTADFGTTANRWVNGYFNNVFTNDLHLKNERGDWTMIEEEDVLTLRNNKTGKRYAISMTPYQG